MLVDIDIIMRVFMKKTVRKNEGEKERRLGFLLKNVGYMHEDIYRREKVGFRPNRRDIDAGL